MRHQVESLAPCKRALGQEPTDHQAVSRGIAILLGRWVIWRYFQVVMGSERHDREQHRQLVGLYVGVWRDVVRRIEDLSQSFLRDDLVPELSQAPRWAQATYDQPKYRLYESMSASVSSLPGSNALSNAILDSGR